MDSLTEGKVTPELQERFDGKPGLVVATKHLIGWNGNRLLYRSTKARRRVFSFLEFKGELKFSTWDQYVREGR